MQRGRFNNPVQAVMVGVKELFATKANIRKIKDSDRLDNQVCLITGANSGVGWGVAKLWASKGANLIMAGRSGIPEKGEELKELTGNDQVRMYRLDLSEFESIDEFVDNLKKDNVKLDVALFNAGMASAKDKQTKSGLEELFMVNYLSKFYLINRLLQEGIIPNETYANSDKTGIPRILITSSDSHRHASEIDFGAFGVYKTYGVKGGINNYSYYKLVLNTFASELTGVFSNDEEIDVAIYPICPGPVDTNIVRGAPFMLNLFLKGIFKTFFQSPEKAATPFLYLATAPELEGRTGVYHHMKTEKRMDEKVYQERMRKALWNKSLKLIKEYHPDYKWPAK